MFVCLFKKVTVQKNGELSLISCNNSSNSLCIGGNDGFLKVVQIDFTKQRKNEDGSVASPVFFSQSLSSHKKRLSHINWNDRYDKLTTCDEEGVIVVWKFIEREDGEERNQWETEMINNREISNVTDIRWSPMGNFLCFIYEDGHAIVGTVDGSRNWGNDITSGKLLRLEWSPDESFILFYILNSNIIIFSVNGYQIGEMEIPLHLLQLKVAEITWWTNSLIENKTIVDNKHLAIVYENGTILLFDNHHDLKPYEIKTEFIKVTKAQWSPNGELLAISGIIKEGEEYKDCISFYSNSGQYFQDIKLTNKISSFCWESYGSKLVITTEGFLLYCLIKPEYKWTYFSQTLVYSFMTDSEHHTIVFWDMKKNTKSFKYVKNLISITSYGAFCCLTAKILDDRYIAILCNSIGSPVDNRIINIRPEYITMNETHIIIASSHYVYIWQYRYQRQDMSMRYGNKINSELLNKNLMKEIIFFIEEIPDVKSFYSINTFKPTQTTKDLISSISCNEKSLIISCETGRGFLYDLIVIGSPEKYFFGTKIIKIGLSPNSNYAWGIDDTYIFSIWDLTKEPNKGQVASNLKGEKLEIESTDVWSVIWSKDDNNSFAFLKKNELNLYKDFKCEEILTCSGYLAEFSDLSLNTIMLEDLLIKPSVDNKYNVNDISIVFETRTLRDLRVMIESCNPIEDLFSYVERHNNNKLWQLFIEYAMLKLDFSISEKCLVIKQDFIGLSLLKRVKTIEDDDFKKAEIHQHFFNYDKAEEIYRNKERRDLLINMRIKLGQWEKVIEIINESDIIEEDNLKIAANNLALQLIEKKDYKKAEELLLKTGNRQELINIWLITEEFTKAADYIFHLPEESEFLLYMGEKFEAYGLTDEAVKCYIRYGDIKKAFDICVLTNQWNLAVEIAEQNNLFQVEGVVETFSKHLKDKNKKMELVEFYRKAHKHTEAAKILIQIAEELREINTSPLILKKIYVLAALEMETFKTRYMDAQITTTMTTNNPNLGRPTQTKTLDTLITSDLSNLGDKALNNPWRGAEAYHYYIICQNQIYNKEYSSALKTSLRLVQFEKELGSKEVYRLIVLSALLNSSLKECSSALAKLKNLSSLKEEEANKFDELSFSIFTKNRPINQKEQILKCPGKDCQEQISEFDIDCKSCGSNFSACVISGQSLFFKEYIKCKRCKHKSLLTEMTIKRIKNCLMCHTKLNLADKTTNKA